MPRRLILVGGLAAFAAGCALPAGAQQPAIAGNGLAQTVECDGGDAVLRGNNDQITFHGSCRSLLVEGSDNQLRADVVPDAPVQVRGNNNQVRYHVLGGTRDARVQVAGNGDDVSPDAGPGAAPADRAAPPPGGPVLALREENARRDVDCTGRDVVVEGNGDEYTLRGGCRSLTVRGEGLTVRAEMQPGARIKVEGNGDTVGWSVAGGGAEPVISLNGEGSRITPVGMAAAPAPAHVAALPPAAEAAAATPPAPHPAAVHPAPAVAAGPAPSHAAPGGSLPGAALVVRGDHEARDVDCNNRDVKVEGNYGIFVLRGACRSVAVKGDSDKVQAEIAPGSHISINGAASTVAYVVIGTGPDPQVAVAGEGSRAWQIPRLGAVTPAGADEGDAPVTTEPPNIGEGTQPKQP